MLIIKNWIREYVCFRSTFALSLLFFVIIGCALKPKQFDNNINGAQLIVEPAILHLGVAWISSNEIMFKGIGFIPGENFCVDLTGSEDINRNISVPICCGVVDENGKFNKNAEKLVKADYLLNAEITTGEKGYLIIINRPPIPEGAYLATAKGFKSNIEAKHSITVVGPTFKDQFMDWMAQIIGKVKKE